MKWFTKLFSRSKDIYYKEKIAARIKNHLLKNGYKISKDDISYIQKGIDKRTMSYVSVRFNLDDIVVSRMEPFVNINLGFKIYEYPYDDYKVVPNILKRVKIFEQYLQEKQLIKEEPQDEASS